MKWTGVASQSQELHSRLDPFKSGCAETQKLWKKMEQGSELSLPMKSLLFLENLWSMCFSSNQIKSNQILFEPKITIYTLSHWVFTNSTDVKSSALTHWEKTPKQDKL